MAKKVHAYNLHTTLGNHTTHLETKILEAAQATRYPPEAGQEENEKGHGCLKYIQVQYCQQEGQKRLL